MEVRPRRQFASLTAPDRQTQPHTDAPTNTKKNALASKQSSRPQRRLKPVLVSCLVIGVMGGGSAAAYLYTHKDMPPFANLDKLGQISFSVYYPVSKDNSFTINKDSFRSEQGIVFFEAVTKNGKKIVFSEQAKQTGADYSFLKGDLNIANNLGVVQIKKSDQGYIGSLETSDSLIIASSADQIEQVEFVQLLRTFKKL